MKYKKKTMIESLRESIARRQNESYERFMQEKADVFQVTNTKEQAMFWVLSPWSIKETISFRHSQ